MVMERIGIVGAGNVGVALALALKRNGYTLTGLCCRTKESAQHSAAKLATEQFTDPVEITRRADIIFITTPDSFIEEVCQQIASREGFSKGQVVLHTSGAHTSHLLESAREAGAYVLSMHPLQTFPSAETGLQNLPGTYFTMEGDEEALQVGQKLVVALEGNALTISTEMKPLYHAAACVSCNYFVALLDMGLKMMETSGVPRDEALSALMPLIEGTLANVKRVGVPRALTGPIDRGDADTIGSHIERIKKEMPQLLEVYRRLGNYTALVANEKGTLSAEGRHKITKALETE